MDPRDTTPESNIADGWNVPAVAGVVIGLLGVALAVPGAILAVEKLRRAGA